MELNNLGACRVVNKSQESYDVYIGRGSKWGNPYTHLKKETKAEYRVSTREESIDKFRAYITEGEGKHLLNNLDELEGKTLGCYCKPLSCHGDILLELVNQNIIKSLLRNK